MEKYTAYESRMTWKLRRYKAILFVLIAILYSSNTYAEHSWNFKTAPVSDALGIYNIEVDYAIHPSFTLGAAYYGFDYELSDTLYESDAAGLRVNYYFDSVQNGGWLLSLSGLWGSFDISELNDTDGNRYNASISTNIYTLLISYQAVWDNFNLTTGIGMSYWSLPETVTGYNGINTYPINTSLLSGTIPNAELMLGWRF